jgi:hypothetical protein
MKKRSRAGGKAIMGRLDDFMQFIGQLARQPFTEFLGKAAIVPESFLARLAETGPDAFADIGLSQIAKDRTGIVDLVRERDTQNIFIGAVEMRQIGFLSLLPVCLLE